MDQQSPRVNRFDRMVGWQRAAVLVATVVAIGIVLLIAAEAALRVRDRLRHGSFWGIEETYEVDKASGLRIPVPGGHFGPIVINSQGFRSPEIPLAKPKGGLRIAFLGSSTTYCAEVSSNAMTWPNLVWQALHKHWPAVPLDYINAGVPGYTAQDDLRNLQQRVAQLKPDIIVIYEAPNDLTADSFELAKEQGIVHQHQEAGIGWLARHSLLVYLIEKNLEVWRQQRLAEATTGKIKLDMARLDSEFRRDYANLVKASQNIAKLVVTVTFSPRIRPQQSPEERTKAAVTDLYYMPYMTVDDLVTAYAGYNQVIRDVAEANGTLLIGDADSIPADARHYADSVHFTDAGSVVMAHRVARAMISSEAVQRLFGEIPRATW